MSKEFNVPPVVFPSSSSYASTPVPAPAPAFPQHRRAPTPTPTFTPSNSNPNPALPFISFDIGSTASSSSFSAPVFASSSSTINPLSFDDEPPLLEELGINTRLIYRKTLSVLNPFRINPNLHEDADLSGPFLFLLSFGLFQLLAGKFHFGIVLGWLTVCALFIYVVFNMLAGRNGNLDLYRCLSLVGYCMLPMVIFSAVALFVPGGVGVVMFVLGAIFVMWSTRVCTGLLVEIAVGGEEHRGLIGYACWLVYMLFALLVVF